MEAVFLAGGFGTRLSEETKKIPKPMVEIGNEPILIHLFKYYASFGFKKFIICGGYKVDYIKDYFCNLMRNYYDLNLIFSRNETIFLNSKGIDWEVKIINTGLKTNTAGRLSKIKKYISSNQFLLTYGDGLSNVNLHELVKIHKENKNLATITAVLPPPRFGALVIRDGQVINFREKFENTSSRINGGFMICNKELLNYIKDESDSLEMDILPAIAKKGKLGCFEHNGFWHPMDTMRDKKYLENLWEADLAEWKV